MITAVDTSVLLDVFLADPDFGPASLRALETASRDGQLILCDVVWAEVSAAFDGREAAESALGAIGAIFSPLTASTAAEAGVRWRRYRREGGKRARVIADFLIAAHALEAADRLLTRDRGFQRGYFGDLTLLEP